MVAQVGLNSLISLIPTAHTLDSIFSSIRKSFTLDSEDIVMLPSHPNSTFACIFEIFSHGNIALCRFIVESLTLPHSYFG